MKLSKRNFLASIGASALGVSIFPGNKALATTQSSTRPRLQLGDLVKRRYAPSPGTASGWGYAVVIGLLLRKEAAYIRAYYEEVDQRSTKQDEARRLGVSYDDFCKSNPWPNWLWQGLDKNGNSLSPNPAYTRRGYLLQHTYDIFHTIEVWDGLTESRAWQKLLPGEIVAPNEVQSEELPTGEAYEERIRNPLGPFFKTV
jgi:hypothetical protein